MSIWEFASNSPWLAFFLALIAAISIETIVTCPLKAYKLYLRRKNISQHGWPTAPIDADGDVVLPKKEGNE